ncbi:MAG: mandelate racemase/muconate lactonizing enzyme family protein [Alphaproteobacteria bacterium]|nr:mandelate racemase/muconate lactonizing enzyme family protein [Alphaproteobacteria bacterium]
MKITRVSAQGYSAPVAVPLWTAHEAMKAAFDIIVTVETDAGITGHGHIHTGPIPEVVEWVGRLGEMILGRDARAHMAVWEHLFSLTSPRPGAWEGRGGEPKPLPRPARPQIMAAIGGIDIALWDIKGKAAGMPVWALLGGSGEPVPAYATGGYYRPGGSDAVYAEELAGFVAKGFRAVKLKAGGETVADDARRIGAVRRAIGADVALMLDLNAPYDLTTAIAAAHAFAPHGITWLEEILHWHATAQDWARLAAASPVPLAHGEREITRLPVRDLIDAGAIRFVQFDATRAAGFTEALRIGRYAAEKGVLVAPHTMPEIHAHLVSALPGHGYIVEAHPDDVRDPLGHVLFANRPHLTKDGRWPLPDAPGFGLEIDWKSIERWRVA